MIVVTGAAGFIASALVSKLNSEGFNNIVLVDDFSFEEKNLNLEGKNYVDRVERERQRNGLLQLNVQTLYASLSGE